MTEHAGERVDRQRGHREQRWWMVAHLQAHARRQRAPLFVTSSRLIDLRQLNGIIHMPWVTMRVFKAKTLPYTLSPSSVHCHSRMIEVWQEVKLQSHLFQVH